MSEFKLQERLPPGADTEQAVWQTTFPPFYPHLPGMKAFSFRNLCGTIQCFLLDEEVVEAPWRVETALRNVVSYSLEKLFFPPPAFALQGSSTVISAPKQRNRHHISPLCLINSEIKVGIGLVWVKRIS